MKYHKLVVSQRGGPEMLQLVEEDLLAPAPGEVRVRVLTAAVSLPDVEARYGRSPFPPKLPFTPGYAIVGEVDAVGADVHNAQAGERVAVLTVYSGYAEYVTVKAHKLIPVPADLNPVQVVPLILNYIVAYQTLHRAARVKRGDAILIIGASGGIGTAYLQLGQAAGLKMYGLASQAKHSALASYGATLLDYRSQDFVAHIRQAEPGGLDAVFDGIGGEYLGRCFSLLKRGGIWVGYANPRSFSGLLRLLGQVIWLNLLPNGKSVTLYGTGASFLDRRPFLEDWGKLFAMLRDGQIAPLIAATFPLADVVQANALLESGQVTGNIVLIAEGAKPNQEHGS